MIVSAPILASMGYSALFNLALDDDSVPLGLP
jgi:hypothetical protein